MKKRERIGARRIGWNAALLLGIPLAMVIVLYLLLWV